MSSPRLSGAGRVVAVIPARGGSKGIPGKNLRLIGGVSLIGRAVIAAMAAPEVDLVVVSSDDEQILAAAVSFGATPLRRPDEISGDTASSEAAVLHALETLAEHGQVFDTVIFMQCTSPFTSAADVSAVVHAFDDSEVNSALTVSPNHGLLWRRGPDNRAAGVNHDEFQPRKRRQDMEPEFQENGAVYGMRIPEFQASKQRFLAPISLVETELPVVEIDEPADLEIVDAMVAQREGAWPALAEVSVDDLLAIKVLVTDFDGVHTDDSVIVDETGMEAVRCSRRDGLGISMLREQTDVEFLILSKETNPVVTCRAQKLKAQVIQGVGAKLGVLDEWLKNRGLNFDDLAYVGNDLNDLECLEAARIGFIPSDAHKGVCRQGIFKLEYGGGAGAVRQVCDLLLTARGKLQHR